MKRYIIRRWKSSTDYETEYGNARQYYQSCQLRNYLRRWKTIHFQVIEARTNLIKDYQSAKEKEQMFRNNKVTELLHFLQTQDNKHMTNSNEKVPYSISSLQSQKVPKKPQKAKIVRHTMQKQHTDEKERKALKEKLVQSAVKKDGQKSSMSVHCKDEQERISYLRKKREEKRIRKRREDTIELSKKARTLAKLHYSLTLLRRFLSHWNAYIKERRLYFMKAVKFCNDELLTKCFYELHYYIKEKHRRQYETRFQNAGKINHWVQMVSFSAIQSLFHLIVVFKR